MEHQACKSLQAAGPGVKRWSIRPAKACRQQALASKDETSGLQKLAGSRPWRQKMKHQACKSLQAAGPGVKR